MPSQIVLLTDYGYKDHYAGVLKGVITSIHPDCRIVDLTHGISPQNILEAAVCLRNAYVYFPKGALFLCVVDPGVGTSRKILCMKTPRHYFVSPDNGLLDLVRGEIKAVSVVSLENQKYYFKQKPSSTFHGRDIMASAAAHLSRSPRIFRRLGPAVPYRFRLSIPKVKTASNSIQGAVLYLDHFGNAITNIRKDLRPWSFWKNAEISSGHLRLGKLKATYAQAGLGKVIPIFNSGDYLEIAKPYGSAAHLGKFRPGTPVIVQCQR